MLNWKRAHAQLEACKCSTESVHMLNWKYAHAQLEVCVCASGSVHVLNWHEVCICLTDMHMLPIYVYIHTYLYILACFFAGHRKKGRPVMLIRE